MTKVFIDTNFWLIPQRYGIDIFSEIERLIPESYEIVVSESVIEELKKIQKTGKGKDKVAAKIGLSLIEKKIRDIIPERDAVDSLILKISEKEKYLVVCTNDKELRKKLRSSNVKTIGMKKKGKLGFI